MIKVLQLGMTDNLGGIESYLINYYRNIDKNIVQFDFINIYSNKLCFQDEIESLGGKVYDVSSYYRHPIKYLKEVSAIMKDNDYKIIHCNMNSAAMIYPLIAAKISHRKVIIAHSHNSSNDKGLLKSLLHNINKIFIPFLATHYFACSEEAGRYFFSNRILKSKKFHIIKNPIDQAKFDYNEKIRNKKRKELSIEDDTFVIGHVGRFEKQKNHDFLIDIFYEFEKKNPKCKLMLVGVGSQQDKIREKVKQLNLDSKVLFLNNRNDVNELMQAFDIFVFPSLYEGLPIVLIEAQCSGLSVFVSDNISKETKVCNNYYGISLNQDAKSWNDKICEALKKPNCRKRIEKCDYDINKCLDELQNFYIINSKEG